MDRLYGEYEYTFDDRDRTKGMDFVQKYLRMKHVIVFKMSHDVLQVRIGDVANNSTLTMIHHSSTFTIIPRSYFRHRACSSPTSTRTTNSRGSRSAKSWSSPYFLLRMPALKSGSSTTSLSRSSATAVKCLSPFAMPVGNPGRRAMEHRHLPPTHLFHQFHLVPRVQPCGRQRSMF